MRNGMAVAVLVIVASIGAGASQSIAKVQLPCESPDQMLSPTGTQVAVRCKDHSLHAIVLPDGTQREVLPADRPANTLAYSPDGHWLAAGFEDGSVEILAADGTAAPRHWKADPHRIDGLYFFPNAKMLLVAPVDSPGQVWELAETPTLRASLPADFGGIVAYAVSPDSKMLVTAGDDTVIRWYDTVTWQKTREYRGFLLETFALAFTPDGKQVIAGGADSRLTMLDAATAKQVRQLPAEALSYVASIDILGGNERAVALYLDDAGEKPPHVLIWDLAAAKSVPFKPEPAATCGGVVAGKLWYCSIEGQTLTISQQE